jgi:hypothetical protein
MHVLIGFDYNYIRTSTVLRCNINKVGSEIICKEYKYSIRYYQGIREPGTLTIVNF